MEEREMLLKTIETLNASIAALSENHKKEVDSLNARIRELTAQVAWLNRQLFGRKSEKRKADGPVFPDLFADEYSDLEKQAEEARDEAVGQIPGEEKPTPSQKRRVRRMLEDLPV